MARNNFYEVTVKEVNITKTQVSRDTNELLVYIDQPWSELSDDLKGLIQLEGERRLRNTTGLGFDASVAIRDPTDTT